MMNNGGAKRFNLYCVKNTAPEIPHHFSFSSRGKKKKERKKKNNLLVRYKKNCGKRECFFFSNKNVQLIFLCGETSNESDRLFTHTHVVLLKDTCLVLRFQNKYEKSICLLSLYYHRRVDTISTSRKGADGHLTLRNEAEAVPVYIFILILLPNFLTEGSF